MGTMKELRDMSAGDLERRATETREALFDDRMKLRTGALASPAQRSNRKRELARVLTVLNEKKAKG